MEIIGNVILRANHVNYKNCTGPKGFNRCYPLGDLEEDWFYSKNMTHNKTEDIFNADWALYKTAEEMGLTPRTLEGELSSYPNDGYYFTWNAQKMTLEQFKKSLGEAEGVFFGNGARAVTLEFTVYVRDKNLFIRIELLFEYSISD